MDIKSLNGLNHSGNHSKSIENNDFSNKPLSGLIFKNEDMKEVSFAGSNLEDAIFYCIEGQHCDFSHTNLKHTQFQDCDLQHCNFSTATNLNEFQFGGSNLAYAKMPDDFSFACLEYIKSSAEQLWTLYLTILAACLYSLLAIGSTNDIDLLGNSKAIFFPMLEMSIATVGFYYVAPILLSALMGGFHFQLMTFWKNLRKVPAIYPDGSSVTIRIMPGLINTFIEAFSPILQQAKTNRMSKKIKLELTWVTLLSVIPITLFCYWFRYLPRQDFIGSYLHAFLFCITLTLARYTWLHIDHEKSAMQRFHASVKIFVITLITVFSMTLIILEGSKLPFTFLYMDVSNQDLDASIKVDESNEENPYYNLMLNDRNLRYAQMNEVSMDRGSLKNSDLRSASITYSNLFQVNLDKAQGEYAQLRFSKVNESSLRQSSFNYADFYQASLQNSDFTQSQLRNTNFIASNLSNSTFSRVNLNNAHMDRITADKSNFSMADLSGTALVRAHMPKAQFDLASISDAHLWKANLTETDWTLSSINNTNFSGTLMIKANLSQTMIEKSSFNEANLQSVKFIASKINSVNFIETNLVNSDFTGAQLNNVSFKRSNLQETNFTDAWFNNVDVSGTNMKGSKGLTSEHIVNLIYDENTIFPEDINVLVHKENKNEDK